MGAWSPLPILLQTLLGYPSLQAGIAMAPRGMGSFIGMPLIGVLIGRFDPRKMVAFGLFVGGLTLFWLGQINLHAGYWDFFWPQFVQGFALSMLFVPLTTISMDPIPREQMGNATSLFNLMRNIGGSIGIATTGTMLARQQQAQINVLGAHVSALESDDADDVRIDTRRVHRGRCRRIHRDAACVCIALRHGATTGGDRFVRLDLSTAGDHLPALDSSDAAHAASWHEGRTRCGALIRSSMNVQLECKISLDRLLAEVDSGVRALAQVTGGKRERSHRAR